MRQFAKLSPRAEHKSICNSTTRVDWLIRNGLDYTDVIQGWGDDCWKLSSLIALLHSRPALPLGCMGVLDDDSRFWNPSDTRQWNHATLVF